MRGEGKSKIVKCKCGHLEGNGVYEVDGRHLVLTSNFGIKKALLGMAYPQRMAQKLLKSACEKEAAKQPALAAAAQAAPPKPIMVPKPTMSGSTSAAAAELAFRERQRRMLGAGTPLKGMSPAHAGITRRLPLRASRSA